jgi:hypothetical protein
MALEIKLPLRPSNYQTCLVKNGAPMTEDPRCCGTGTCIINEKGVCWCGQTWDGEKMCMPTALKNESPQETKNTVDLD